MKTLAILVIASLTSYATASPCELTKNTDGGIVIRCDNVFDVVIPEPEPEPEPIVEVFTHCSNQHGVGDGPRDCRYEGLRNFRICAESGVCSTHAVYNGSLQCKKDDFPIVEGLTGSLKCSYSDQVMTQLVAAPANCEDRHDCAGIDLNLGAGYAGSDELKVYNYGNIDTSLQPDGSGAFRIVCRKSHFAYDDPLVFPGQPGAAHLHVFFGFTGTSSSTTADDLDSGSSTCVGGSANRSAYWAPALIDMNTKEVMEPDSEPLWYYKGGFSADTAIPRTAPPKGLSIITHNGNWKCSNSPQNHKQIPTDCPVGEQLDLYIEFPECWDGVNLYLADQSHVTRPVGISGSAVCPATHPVLLPTVGMNLHYKIEYPGQTEHLRLSSDMGGVTAGSSIHADVIYGWDEGIINRVVDNCLNTQKNCKAHLLGDGRLLK